MVHELLSAAPAFHDLFNSLIPAVQQQELASAQFLKQRALYYDQISANEFLTAKDKKDRGYFTVNRKFSTLVPSFYKRTVAPRITTTGSTFHGMKKQLQLELLKELTATHGGPYTITPPVCFIDIDMSACHSRVAAYLMYDTASQISLSLEDAGFWKRQIEWATPFFESNGVDLSPEEIKKMLKVMLYTSLNGGNPSSESRLIDNIGNNAKAYLLREKLDTPLLIENSTLYAATYQAASQFALANELKDLNKICAQRGTYTDSYYTSTVDRAEPYSLNSVHLGISRVLQGFEVVLLTLLVKFGLEEGGFPVSLDHDGALFAFDAQVNPTELIKRMNERFLPWSNYLIKRDLPLEVKRLIHSGSSHEV